ncbi:hypothetical protein K4G96_26940, partial [Mycobacterium tuberculosis]|nr:hypothetical protein [Mycobacterium tuberculosis]
LPPRKTGGNDVFRQLLTETMVPQTEANLKIDPHQRAIWGHYCGGLVVLDAWRQASPSGIYSSASPALGPALRPRLQ